MRLRFWLYLKLNESQCVPVRPSDHYKVLSKSLILHPISQISLMSLSGLSSLSFGILRRTSEILCLVIQDFIY